MPSTFLEDMIASMAQLGAHPSMHDEPLFASFEEIPTEFWTSGDFTQVRMTAIEYVQKIGAIDSSYTAEVTEIESKAIIDWVTSPVRKRQMRLIDRKIGALLGHASSLELAVAQLLVVLMNPLDAVDEVQKFLDMTARDRSQFLRTIVRTVTEKKRLSGDWRSIIDAVEREATFRNELAHGQRGAFHRDPELGMQLGYFLSIPKRRGKSWRLIEFELTDEMLLDHSRRMEFLDFVISAIAVSVVVRNWLDGNISLPMSFSRILPLHPASVFYLKKRWFIALRRKMLEPAAKRR